VDTTRTPWNWRPGAGAAAGVPGILQRFQTAAAIREAFFKPGSQQPEVRFTLTADSLDQDASRFLLELDGQQFEYRHGPARGTVMSWPGGPTGQAAVTFESGSGAGANLPFQGPLGLVPAAGAHADPTAVGRALHAQLQRGRQERPSATRGGEHPQSVRASRMLRFHCS